MSKCSAKKKLKLNKKHCIKNDQHFLVIAVTLCHTSQKNHSRIELGKCNCIFFALFLIRITYFSTLRSTIRGWSVYHKKGQIGCPTFSSPSPVVIIVNYHRSCHHPIMYHVPWDEPADAIVVVVTSGVDISDSTPQPSALQHPALLPLS